jgi:hypothetical protein
LPGLKPGAPWHWPGVCGGIFAHCCPTLRTEGSIDEPRKVVENHANAGLRRIVVIHQAQEFDELGAVGLATGLSSGRRRSRGVPESQLTFQAHDFRLRWVFPSTFFRTFDPAQ